MTTAAEVIAWLETLKVTEGSLAGELMTVLPFQREIITGIMEHRISAYSVARSNGKTTLMAGLAACALCGPIAVPRGEVALVASSFKQARKAFEHVKWFLRSTGIDLDDRKLWRMSDNDHSARIEDVRTGAFVWMIGSDPKRAHGGAPLLAILDEPAQWERNDGPRLYAAMRTALGKQTNAKLVAIGTRSDDPDHWFSRLLLPRSRAFSKIFAAPKDLDDDQLFDLDIVRAANPMFDHSPSLRADLLDEMEAAKTEGAEALASWKALHLNMGTADSYEIETIVTQGEWKAATTRRPPARCGPVAVGIDLGSGKSMSVCVFYWPEVGRLEAYGAFPSDPNLAARGKHDGVDDRYVRMEKRREIVVYPGVIVPVGRYFRDMAELIEGEEVISAVADRHRQADARQAMNEADIRWKMEWRATSGTGKGSDGPSDIRAFQAEVVTGHLRTAESLMMESAIVESRIVRDPNGNPGLNKSRARGRIDALQAAVLAVGLGRRWRLPPENAAARDLSRVMMGDAA